MTTMVRGCAMLVAVVLMALPAAASAHVERSSYWPDPAPDCSITPCTGGAVPKIRSLASALDRARPGDTRVVCRPDSLSLARRAIARARRQGYNIRPTDHRTLSAAGARSLRKINARLFARCAFHEIQPAVTASHNNDRVVVMPGLYTEPTARAQPTHDPACDKYKTIADSGDPGALSHDYQIHCPNDANLVSVVGRGSGPGKDPQPALEDRHGIPNLGPCIRCNFQLEGSGVAPDDVVVEAGDPAAGDGGPSAVGHAKDVGIFVDQADGFVLRNMTIRHAREHDIYILESDGYRFDRFKTFYAGSYGVLTFVEDHGLMSNCDAAGNGDSGLYPGAGAKTNAGRDTKYYPTARYSQEIRDCDSHHNDGGYSGTNGAATWIHHNNFYDNALGFTTDVFTAAGHPGYPQQGDLVEDNNFYDNNFNPFVAGSDVKPFIASPVGTGMWIAGGNDNVVRNNRFWNNRRRAVMLFAVPDATVCGPVLGSTTPVPGCAVYKTSTSFRNQFSGNVMGVAPDGSVQPNGVDFWWDSFVGNTGNCWWGNIPAAGRSITSAPASLPACDGGKNPSSSIGIGDVGNEAELVGCLVGFQISGYPNGDPNTCTWAKTPEKPARRSVATTRAASSADLQRRQAFAALCESEPVMRVCAALTGVLPGADPLVGGMRPPAASSLRGAAVRQRLSLYSCRDWQRADPGLRTILLDRLHHFVGGPVESDRLLGYGAVLPDALATTFFDARCGQPYAQSFALYKQYGYAAGFAGVTP